jgi:hypothetical protein
VALATDRDRHVLLAAHCVRDGRCATGAVIRGDFQSDAPVFVFTASRKPLLCYASRSKRMEQRFERG